MHCRSRALLSAEHQPWPDAAGTPLASNALDGSYPLLQQQLLHRHDSTTSDMWLCAAPGQPLQQPLPQPPQPLRTSGLRPSALVLHKQPSSSSSDSQQGADQQLPGLQLQLCADQRGSAPPQPMSGLELSCQASPADMPLPGLQVSPVTTAPAEPAGTDWQGLLHYQGKQEPDQVALLQPQLLLQGQEQQGRAVPDMQQLCHDERQPLAPSLAGGAGWREQAGEGPDDLLFDDLLREMLCEQEREQEQWRGPSSGPGGAQEVPEELPGAGLLGAASSGAAHAWDDASFDMPQVQQRQGQGQQVDFLCVDQQELLPLDAARGSMLPGAATAAQHRLQPSLSRTHTSMDTSHAMCGPTAQEPLDTWRVGPHLPDGYLYDASQLHQGYKGQGNGRGWPPLGASCVSAARPSQQPQRPRLPPRPLPYAIQRAVSESVQRHLHVLLADAVQTAVAAAVEPALAQALQRWER
jgi:hypothetical protein